MLKVRTKNGTESVINKVSLDHTKEEPTSNLLLERHERFHGDVRTGCLLVKCRREEVYRQHYLDIYMCVTHMRETCRCGWEWNWHGGTDSRLLKD